MTNAVAVRKQGDDFQARLFWLHAASLLVPNGTVKRVGYETGPKAFDDVLIEYEAARAPQDHRGRPILRDHLQSKWHVRGGEFGYADLLDPVFINASAVSLLQRAHEAQQRHAPLGEGARFKLVTNWRVNIKDPLIKLVLAQTHALDLDKLFDGTTDASAMGRLRKAWREHLGLDDQALALVIRTLGITLRLESGEELRERLNDRFAAVGLIKVTSDEAGFFYDDLIAKLHAQGRKEFDRVSFRELCETERLFDKDRERNPVTVGVRSFMHPIDNIEARCDQALNLVPHFDGRYIRDEADWNNRLLPELRSFVIDAARETDELRLVLDAHASLAFGVGAILNVKSGKRIAIEQRTGGRRFWSTDDMPADSTWPLMTFEGEVIGAGEEMAVAIGLTHDICPQVKTYLKSNAAIGRLLHARPAGGASQSSVHGGRHATMLAEAIVAKIRSAGTEAPRQGALHLFIAAPNGFSFFLGQNQPALGPCIVYEFDFDGKRGGSYSPGMSVG